MRIDKKLSFEILPVARFFCNGWFFKMDGLKSNDWQSIG
jgi:hypothetical protein